MKNKLTELIEKFKTSKKLQISLFILVVLVIIVCYFSSLFKHQDKQQEPQDLSTSSYVEYLESKLMQNLNNLEGVDNASVMITLESGFEYIYATDEEIKTTSTGTLTTTELVLVSGQPVIEKEIYPTIKGVVVVASGAKDVKVKLNILSVVQTVLEVSNDKITILC